MNSSRLDSLLAHLEGGGIALLMTDTLPGLHALASHPDATLRLAQAKGAAAGRPFLLLFATTEQALAHAGPADPADEARLARVWPGPLTALLAPTPSTPATWVHRGATVAVRVPGPAPLRALLEALGGPLFSTSANPAGAPPPTDLETARAYFPQFPADDLGIVPIGTASTVVDLSVSPGVVQRPGAAPWPPV